MEDAENNRLNPVDRVSLPEQDAFFNAPLRQKLKDALLRRILNGDYKPGTRLKELRIAQEFGTSQAPVREALRDLEGTGLVITRPRRGTYVSESMNKGLREIYAVRGALEEQATRIVTKLKTCNVDLLQLETDAMRKAATDQDLHGLADHSVTFHREIMEKAGNQLLFNIWLSLHIETRTTITLLIEGMDLMDIANSHQPIIDAIKSGDAERAARVAREHQDYIEKLPGVG